MDGEKALANHSYNDMDDAALLAELARLEDLSGCSTKSNLTAVLVELLECKVNTIWPPARM